MTLAERVDAGAAWLDRQKPGWWQTIDLDLLDIKFPCRCVLGQIGAPIAVFTGNRTSGFELFVGWLRCEDGVLVPGWTADHGFYLDDEEDEPELWRELDELWVDAVKARYNQGATL